MSAHISVICDVSWIHWSLYSNFVVIKTYLPHIQTTFECANCQSIMVHPVLQISSFRCIFFPLFAYFYIIRFIFVFFSLFRLTEPKGFIHDGLGNYSIGVKCSWLIDAREPHINATKSSKKKNKLIRLHLEEFATECSWDHLYIYDGDSVQSPLLAVFR